MASRALENLSVDLLKPWARNARTHSRKQIRQIGDSIRRFGFTNPIPIDEERRILAGHGRVEAAKEMGMTEVPCLQVGHMTPAQKRLRDRRQQDRAERGVG
jgi:ParB-like chromosome segregation protein Spo0J